MILIRYENGRVLGGPERGLGGRPARDMGQIGYLKGRRPPTGQDLVRSGPDPGQNRPILTKIGQKSDQKSIDFCPIFVKNR